MENRRVVRAKVSRPSRPDAVGREILRTPEGSTKGHDRRHKLSEGFAALDIELPHAGPVSFAVCRRRCDQKPGLAGISVQKGSEGGKPDQRPRNALAAQTLPQEAVQGGGGWNRQALETKTSLERSRPIERELDPDRDTRNRFLPAKHLQLTPLEMPLQGLVEILDHLSGGTPPRKTALASCRGVLCSSTAFSRKRTCSCISSARQIRAAR